MTVKRAAAITGAIFAVTLATSLFGAAMAAEKERDQTQAPASSIVQGDEGSSSSTAANIHALTVYLQWQKCKDNLLPKCP